MNTTGCAFSGVPRYLTALSGSSGHWSTTGATSIYVPTATGFRVYVRYNNDYPLTPTDANANGWSINWLALTGTTTTVKKYYYSGGQRIAVREGNTLRWLIGDHLGGTAYTVNGTSESGEVRYKPWGATRYLAGTPATTFRYTGQREEATLGLDYYGARWYQIK